MNGYSCPGCSQTFTTENGLAIHRGQIDWMENHGNATGEQTARNRQRERMRASLHRRKEKAATEEAA